jgi:hypothetical protein
MERKRGRGILSSISNLGGKVLNKLVDILPIEAHLPTYSYCGPGTRLEERLRSGSKPKNKLDEYCKEHDIAYANSSDSRARNVADRRLVEQAWTRYKAQDSSLGEKAAALVVTNLMKLKSKFGGGMVKRSIGRRKGRRRRRTRRLLTAANRKTTGSGLYLRRMRGTGLQVGKKRTASSCAGRRTRSRGAR